MRTTFRRWSCLLALSLCCPAVVFAEPRAVVQDFKGPLAKQARTAVVDVLEEHSVELVPPKKVAAVARASGADLDTESGRVRVAKKLQIQAFIIGRLRMVKKRWQVEIAVFGGTDGMPAAEFKAVVTKTTVAREIDAKLWNAIGRVFAEASDTSGFDQVGGINAPAVERQQQQPWRQQQQPPAPVEPYYGQRQQPVQQAPVEPYYGPQQQPMQQRPRQQQPIAVEETENPEALALEQHADQEEPSTLRISAFDVAVGANVGTRSFGYNDSLPGLSVYSLGPSPSLSLHGHWYPGAHFSSTAIAHIGLDVRADLLVGVSSKDKTGAEFSTSSHGFGIGVRGRIPVGALELGLVAGFGQRAFELNASDKTIEPNVPNVVHNFLRFGGEGRYQIIPEIAVQLRLGFLYGLSLGGLTSSEWFPHATGNGVEAEIGFQFSASRLLAFELAAGMQRYFMSLNPQEEDRGVVDQKRVAGGALDKYFSSRLGVILRP